VIRSIKPDFHAKGTDYTSDSVPEKDIVAEVGGKVIIVGDPKDHSSSDMLRKMR
jgi:bifunctional ADP-heptose synthase (sugar kinase/adenylyltransferase)